MIIFQVKFFQRCFRTRLLSGRQFYSIFFNAYDAIVATSVFAIYPAKRLMFQHFVPALFLAREGSVLWFGLDAVIKLFADRTQCLDFYIKPFSSIWTLSLNSLTLCQCRVSFGSSFCYFSYHTIYFFNPLQSLGNFLNTLVPNWGILVLLLMFVQQSL